MIVLPSLPLRNPALSVVYCDRHFTADECDQIVASAKESDWSAGGVGGYGANKAEASVVRKARSCLEQRLPFDQRTGFPLNRIANDIGVANSNGWRFDLTGFVSDDMPYIMRYAETNQDHYDWHVDMGRAYAASRKLGFSLQLSNSDDYEGGDLEFHNMDLDRDALRTKGALAIFPAYWLHRVVPVTKGTRDVAVGWMHGPSFR